MFSSDKGIVLSRQKYNDNSLIVRIYTEKYGKQSYIFYGYGSKKAQSKFNFVQPLYILDLSVYHKTYGTLQKVKNFAPEIIFHHLPFSATKSSIAFFVAELIDFSLKENEPDSDCYQFIKSATLMLDLMSDSFANFHPAFMLQFSKYLGFYPIDNYSETSKTFDLIAGKYILGIPQHDKFLNLEHSELLHKLHKISFSEFQQLKISNAERNKLIDILLQYFAIHLEKNQQLKSLDVLRTLFS